MSSNSRNSSTLSTNKVRVKNENYFSIDDILATQAKIPCKFEVTVYNLGEKSASGIMIFFIWPNIYYKCSITNVQPLILCPFLFVP